MNLIIAFLSTKFKKSSGKMQVPTEEVKQECKIK